MSDWQFTDAYSPEAVERLGRGRIMEPPQVVPTGFPAVDHKLWFWGASRGIPCGEYVIVGGASNAGKTQFGLWLVKQAMKAELDAGVVSLEMRAEDIQIRLYQAMLPGLDYKAWQPGKWTADNATALEDAAAKIRDRYTSRLLINSDFNADLDAIMAACNELRDNGCRLILLDHLQLVRVGGMGDDQISGRTEAVSETIRRWAFTNEVTVVGLSQLNRGASRERNRTPSMFDLWGGTSLESNASLIFMLDHSRYSKDPGDPAVARTFLLHEKSRIGPAGYEVPVLVDHRTLEWSQPVPSEEHRWPTHDNEDRWT